MKTILLFATGLLLYTSNSSQNVGINTTIPSQKLKIAGTTKTNSLIIATGDSQSDFLIKNDVNGQIGFRKGYITLGLNYIIALQDAFPLQSPPFVSGTYIGEIKLFSGNNPPFGWAFCNGQLLTVTGNETLFAIIGTTYGGNGVTEFSLPDLRNAVPADAETN